MKKHIFMVLMAVFCLALFSQKAHAIDVYVASFDIRFSDPNFDPGPPPSCWYQVDWELTLKNSDGSLAWQSGWINVCSNCYPGTYSGGGTTIYNCPTPQSGQYFQVIARAIKQCVTPNVTHYGNSSPLDLDEKYHLSPNSITIPSF
jgi:hypothetical protein